MVRASICWLYKTKDGTMFLPKHVLMRDLKVWSFYRKPNPGMILDLMAYYRFTPAETTLVGDSADDEGAARAAKVTFVKVNFEKEKV